MAPLLIFLVATFVTMGIGSADDAFLDCPTISNGFYPNCECKYGPKYDEETNTCPNPECPVSNSTGIYPDCMCLHKNFDYSIYINECFRVCPENSTGYWPKCDCDDDGYVFDKSTFECKSCPIESSGLYPNCICDEDVAIYNSYDNSCKKCVDGSVGILPDCICPDGYVYNVYSNLCALPTDDELQFFGCKNVKYDNFETNENVGNDENFNISMMLVINNSSSCLQCPFDSTGDHPNCFCGPNSTYSESDNLCLRCPYDSVGVYPECICEGNGLFVMNTCYACPADSTGEYPECICTYPFQYDNETNLCAECPSNSSGVYPDCECKNGLFSRIQNTCVECPVDSTGFYPHCECQDEGLIYSAYINQCYIQCPDNSSGIHPHCQCYYQLYYDENDFSCKSFIGRECPLDSIGVGPDCLCMRSGEKFSSFLWNCIGTGASSAAGFAGIGSLCPDDNEKYPQCSVSINQKTLTSLIG